MVIYGPYREQAVVNRTQQKEQLDHPLTLTAPNERLFLTGLGIVFAAVLVWLIFGSVDRTISTDGVLAGTVVRHEVVSDMEGRLEAWLVVPGDRVEAGAPIARLAFPKLDARIAALRDRVTAMETALGGSRGGGGLEWELATARMALLWLEADRTAKGDVASPATGEIVDPQPAPGDHVEVGERIASVRTVGGSSAVQALARVPDRIAREIEPGMPATIAVALAGEPRRTFAAEVVAVSPPSGGAMERGAGVLAEPLWTVRLSVDTGDLRPSEDATIRMKIALGKRSPAELIGLARP